MHTLCVCDWVRAFFTLVHVTCNKFTSMWNTKRVHNLCVQYACSSEIPIKLSRCCWCVQFIECNVLRVHFCYFFSFFRFFRNYVDNEIWFLNAWVLCSTFYYDKNSISNEIRSLMSVNIQWSRSKHRINAYQCYTSQMSPACAYKILRMQQLNALVYVNRSIITAIIDFVCEIVDARRSHSIDPILSRMS